MEDRTKRRARFILILGVVIALIAGIGAFTVLSSAPSGAPAAPPPTTPVVVAARELPVRTALAAADVIVREYKQDTVPLTSFRTVEEVLGKVLVTPVAAGEPLLPTKLSAAGAAPFTVFPPGLSVSPTQPLPPNTPNYRAISISVPDAQAVGGVLQVGDLVDILYTLSFDPAKYLRPPANPDRIADFTSKVVLQSVPILARQAAVYTIRTDVETAERIAFLQASAATLQMLLRGAGDQRTPVTTGATFQTVFDQFKPKIPERFAAP